MIVNVNAHFNSSTQAFEYDTTSGHELFFYQIVSLFPELVLVPVDTFRENAALVVLSPLGCPIRSDEDLQATISTMAFEQEPRQPLLHVNVWLVLHTGNGTGTHIDDNDLCLLRDYGGCTAAVCHGDVPQCVKRFVDTDFKLCQRCSTMTAALCDSSLLSDASHELDSFKCDGLQLIEMGLLPSFTTGAGSNPAPSPHDMAPAVALYLKRLVFEQSKRSQAAALDARMLTADIRSSRSEFLSRLKSGWQTVQVYEDPVQQEQARAHIDYATVLTYTEAYLSSSASNSTSSDQPPQPAMAADVAMLHGLMQWFKCDFFKWCNKPNCDHCQAAGGTMSSAGMAHPTDIERSVGWAGRVEVYHCPNCGQQTRFPRFNNPSHLLTSRKGRCGEFANCFALICRSLGFDTRYVLDFTDHVWVEVYVPSMKRYVHADPCERKLDAPLMYESGWGKKLTFVLSFSRFGVADATSKYSRKLGEVVSRRGAIGEAFVDDAVAKLDRDIEASYFTLFSSHTISASAESDLNSEAHYRALRTCSSDNPTIVTAAFAALAHHNCGLSVATMKSRKSELNRELLGMQFLNYTSLKVEELQSRISGDVAWKLSRGEAGKQAPAEICDAAGTVGIKGSVCAVPESDRLCWLVDGMVLSAAGRCLDICMVGSTKAGLDSIPATLSAPSEARPVIPHPSSSIVVNEVPVWQHHQHRSPESAGLGCVSVAIAHGALFALASLQSLSAAPSSDGEELSQLEQLNTIPISTKGHCVLRSCYASTEDEMQSLVPNATSAVVATGKDIAVLGGLSPISASGWVATRLCLHCPPEPVADIDSFHHKTAMTSLSSGFICRVPSQVLARLPDEDPEQFKSRLASICLASPNTVGYTVNQTSDVGTLFGTTGYPLRPSEGSQCALKTVTLSDQSANAALPDAPHIKQGDYLIAANIKYLFLGGASHGDTTTFDNAASLHDLLTFATSHIARRCRVRPQAIHVRAGASLVNSVQCDVEIVDESKNAVIATTCSPIVPANHDEPVLHSLPLSDDIKVRSVSVQYGALVDSLSFELSNGIVHKFGGSGGGASKKITIPDGWTLCGFFGGYGGHLHNVGLCIAADHPDSDHDCTQPLEEDSSSLAQALLEAAVGAGVHQALAMNYYQECTYLSSQNFVGTLVETVLNIIENNTREKALALFNSLITYSKNIIKAPTDPKFLKINVSNGYFTKNVGSIRGGLELLSFGPLGFRLNDSMQSLELVQKRITPAYLQHCECIVSFYEIVVAMLG